MNSSTVAKTDAPVRRSAAAAIVAIVVETALAMHLVAAAFIWWLAPHGFPWGHPRFWTNTALPMAAILVACVGLVAMLRRRPVIAAGAVLGFASAWFVGGVTSRILFPVSLRSLWCGALFVAAMGLVLFWLLFRGDTGKRQRWLLCMVTGAVIGWGTAFAIRPPTPATQALDLEAPDLIATDSATEIAEPLELAQGSHFYPSLAQLVFHQSGVRIQCDPLLTFEVVSPDGLWSILAPNSGGNAGRRFRQQESDENTHAFHYDDGSTVYVPANTDAQRIELTAFTPVAKDTYTHLNSYCVIRVTGHQRLSLSFSPCSETLIHVLPADYPSGRPARFAYLDHDGKFRVVVASSGEKGPFRSFADGMLERGVPLTIGFHDEGRMVASITLHDWSAQLSTNLSPTAGWRVPENSIEFLREGDAFDAPITIWISLAATSIGRGWDTVGHRAGTYRNRITVRLEPADAEWDGDDFVKQSDALSRG